MTNPQLSIDRQDERLWRVTFENQPINLVNPRMVGELRALVDAMESEPALKVVVFRSADPDFFLAHWDLLAERMTIGPDGMHPWPDVLVRLSRVPVVTIAEIRGRARGAGSEFVLACDMRFASAERAILGQFEVGLGVVPGANPMARLAGLMGRGRALETVLGADDFPAPLAERYGYINRALPDAELLGFVDALAKRLASFEKQALVGTKKLLDEATLPSDAVFPAAMQACLACLREPGTQARAAELLRRGLQSRSGVELALGTVVGQLGESI
jgi:enoyl-CoA hydratase/carnithine racemase